MNIQGFDVDEQTISEMKEANEIPIPCKKCNKVLLAVNKQGLSSNRIYCESCEAEVMSLRNESYVLCSGCRRNKLLTRNIRAKLYCGNCKGKEALFNKFGAKTGTITQKERDRIANDNTISTGSRFYGKDK